MQVEHILLNNNVPCLSKSLHLDAGVAPLGELTDIVGAGPGALAMDLLGPAAPILQPSPPFQTAAEHLGGPSTSCDQDLAGASEDANKSYSSVADGQPAGWQQPGNTEPSPQVLNPDLASAAELSSTSEAGEPSQAQQGAQQQHPGDCAGASRKRTAAAMEADADETSRPSPSSCDNTWRGDDPGGPSPHPQSEDGQPQAFDPSTSAPDVSLAAQPDPGSTTEDLAGHTVPSSGLPNGLGTTGPAQEHQQPGVSGVSTSMDTREPNTTASAGANVVGGSGAGASGCGGVVADMLAVELHQIVTTRSGGVSEPRFAGRLTALVDSEERLGGRLTLLSVVQQSTQEVLRAFVQGTGLRSLERWVVQFRDENKHQPLVSVIGCLKMLPIDLTALKGSSIGQTVGKLRKHTNPLVRGAASELVEQWKGVVDRSVGKGEARQGLKSKPDASSQDGPNKRAKKVEPPVAAVASGTAAKPAAASAGPSGGAPAAASATTSKLAVMDDDLLSGSGSGTAAQVPHGDGPHKGLLNFMKNRKKVHAVKLENVPIGRLGMGAAAGTAAAASGAGGDASAGGDSGGSLSPTSSGDATAAASEAAAGVDAGPDSPKPGGGDTSPSGQLPSLLPLSGADGAASGGVPKPVTLPRLGTLAGPSTPTVRLGSLRDGSLPTAGIARLGAVGGGAGGVGGRVGAAASLPAAVAPGGPQSAHARAMAARARAPSPEPAPRKEKRKAVSWAGDEALAAYRLFKKDDPPQLAASDALLTADDDAATTLEPGAPGAPSSVGGVPGAVPSGGLLPPPGFQSAARREHASERMALAAQHQQEELERQQEMERWAALRPTVPWVEPPELYLGAVSPQQLPALGEESTEREVQAQLRQCSLRVSYMPATIPPSPAEPTYEPEPDLYRVRHIPLNVPGVAPGVGGVLQPPPMGGMLQPGLYGGVGQQPLPQAAAVMGGHPGVPPPPYGGQLPHGQALPPPPLPPPPGLQQPVVVPQPQPQHQQPGQPGSAAAAQGGGLTLSPDLVASLPGLISSLSQQPQQQQPQPGQGVPLGQGQPTPAHVLPHPHPHGLPLSNSHPQPHPVANPNARMGGGPPQPQQVPPPAQQQLPGQTPLMPAGGPAGAPIPYGMHAPPHPAMGAPGPGGVPPGPASRPGSRFEPGPGPGPGMGAAGGGGPPPPPPRKEGQPTLMRPRRSDDPPGPGIPPLCPPHPHPHSHPPHLMGPGLGMRHPGPPPHPHSHPHTMGPGPGGWAPPPGGPGGGPPSTKVCAYFNTPGGCRNGEGCRFLHLHGGQDAGPQGQYEGGPYAGPGRGSVGMGRPGGPPGMPSGGVRRR